ncbi:uncharacterized protein LOC131627863, partial [Vicia villosa]|uniref:uncharacterized protein LOC131627863 n=1 Tax=Vicia villosa TaxID=3911 RepID=UPI00273B096D
MDRPYITIPEEECEAGIDECKNNLYGRVLWPKGTAPLVVATLRKKHALIWPEVKNWGVQSLRISIHQYKTTFLLKCELNSMGCHRNTRGRRYLLFLATLVHRIEMETDEEFKEGEVKDDCEKVIYELDKLEVKKTVNGISYGNCIWQALVWVERNIESWGMVFCGGLQGCFL